MTAVLRYCHRKSLVAPRPDVLVSDRCRLRASRQHYDRCGQRDADIANASTSSLHRISLLICSRAPETRETLICLYDCLEPRLPHEPVVFIDDDNKRVDQLSRDFPRRTSFQRNDRAFAGSRSLRAIRLHSVGHLPRRNCASRNVRLPHGPLRLTYAPDQLHTQGASPATRSVPTGNASANPSTMFASQSAYRSSFFLSVLSANARRP